MSNQKEQPQPPKRSATERLADLENGALQLFHLNNTLVKDVMILKEALKLLDNKVNAITKASNSGEELSDVVLSRIMLEHDMEVLAEKVKTMVLQGMLIAEETVSDNSFLVGKELASDGTVVHQRLQFALKAVKPEHQEKIVGAKVGETVDIEENVKFLVLESYSIHAPEEAPQAPVSEAAPTEPTDTNIGQTENSETPVPTENN